jgi:hypothetical protein
LALALVGLGCEPSSEPEAAAPAPSTPGVTIDFPAELQPEDTEVTAFIRRVIETCNGGDYDAFRLLWSAKDDPFPRDAFERGWRAVQQVTIRDVQKLRRKAEGDVVYGVHASVVLDGSVPEPTREVVLLLVREMGQWRLARAPAALRKRFLGEDAEQESAPTPLSSQPAAPASQPGQPESMQ